ncbi:hypothetical protein HB662_21690 [Roseomonas frigidaquae]|uniref:Glycosyl transferase family 1 domain-containing protein n=1 Tax=Falsiroseomonas frigidaquae TaxID=487318 RepID=A0ABX1F4W7_9PROT|nr:hypothetical protein [Falsiroseomonas frigidaquae]NKE47405.1 hypothetical protein [Falsiroseomonas frigidaquae]
MSGFSDDTAGLSDIVENQLAHYAFDVPLREALDAAPDDDALFLRIYRDRIEQHGVARPKLFDEIFYLQHNPDILAELRKDVLRSGLHHFAGWGIFEGRPPNADWHSRMRFVPQREVPMPVDEAAYLAEQPECAAFLADFPQLSVGRFIDLYGRRLGRRPDDNAAELRNQAANPERLQLLRAFFDAGYYASTYLGWDASHEMAFDHYVTRGAREGHSPNSNFDERFYLAFYPDIAVAVGRGYLLCGYEHWLIAGQREGRLPRFELAATLEAAAPGVTRPVALHSADAVAAKLEPCAFSVDEAATTRVWFVLPFLNPDLIFGGFASIIAFIEQLLTRHVRVGIFLREAEESQVEYFRYRSGQRSLLARSLSQIPVFSPQSGRTFVFSPQDVFVSYSVWDAHWARHFAAETHWKRPIYWIQEYEPIFHKHDAWHFLSNSAYYYDHIGVFNSALLKTYFEKYQIGVYGQVWPESSISFEHLLYHPGDHVPRQARREGARRTFFVYARPEEHASRNMFELAVFCLRKAVEAGIFIGPWRFIGLGALAGPYRISLGAGWSMEVLNKIDAEEYAKLIGSVDIGLSLMYAPHPSLLPYEIANAGALVVTNAFPGREATYIQGRSNNIIVFEGTVDAALDALREAVRRSNTQETAPAPPDAAFPDTRLGGWECVFHDEFLTHLALLIDRRFSWQFFRDEARDEEAS